MKQIFKIVLGVFTIAGVGLLFLFSNGSDEMNSKIKDHNIVFKNIDKKLYFSARAWGLGGNHEEIVLSSSSIDREHQSYDKENCYIFYTRSLYYKIGDGSNLIIYVDQSSISKPSNFGSEIKIIIKGLNTATELENYYNNYKDYGLTKVSIFD